MKLLEHFKELSLHPKNAEELKGLIIRLALRGKLTEKWREDNSVNENATDLLAKIKEEKASLILKRKLKLRKVEEIQATKDMMYNIPETWCWYNFSDVVFFQEGPGIRKWQFRDEGVKLLNVQNIVGDKLVLENTNKHVQLDEFEQKYRHFKVEEGDLLFASSGGSWGKSAWFIDPGYDVMLNTSMIRMCFYGKKWYPSYLKTFVSSGIFIDQMTEQLVGMQPNFGSTHLSRIYIPIPPLEEQKALVEVVNTLFAEVEQLESLTKERVQLKESFVVSALNRLTESENTQQEWNFLQKHFSSFFTEKKNIKSLRETILQLAVQGKLTEDWRTNNPNTEPASELLKRIEAEKQQLIAEKKIKKEKPLSPIQDDEIPYELPHGWVWSRLGKYAHYGALSKAENKDTKEDTWVLELEDIEKDSSRLLKKVRFNERVFKSTKSRFKVSDVVYGKLRPYLDKVIVADEAGVCTTEMIPIKSFSYSSPEYLRWFLKSKGFIKYANGSTHGMRMPRLGTDVAKQAIISIPPAEEQKIIAEKVNILMALCDELEQQIETSQTQIEQLMQSCLKEVFEQA